MLFHDDRDEGGRQEFSQGRADSSGNKKDRFSMTPGVVG